MKQRISKEQYVSPLAVFITRRFAPSLFQSKTLLTLRRSSLRSSHGSPSTIYSQSSVTTLAVQRIQLCWDLDLDGTEDGLAANYVLSIDSGSAVSVGLALCSSETSATLGDVSQISFFVAITDGSSDAGEELVLADTQAPYHATIDANSAFFSPTAGGSVEGIITAQILTEDSGTTYTTVNSLQIIAYHAPTIAPTFAPTLSPTLAPTVSPTKAPSKSPTLAPTIAPTLAPTLGPTLGPTLSPTEAPTKAPTEAPTQSPTKAPTEALTLAPSLPLTPAPSLPPTPSPSIPPTAGPTALPTVSPTIVAQRQVEAASYCECTDCHYYIISNTCPTPAPTTAPTSCPTSTVSDYMYIIIASGVGSILMGLLLGFNLRGYVLGLGFGCTSKKLDKIQPVGGDKDTVASIHDDDEKQDTTRGPSPTPSETEKVRSIANFMTPTRRLTGAAKMRRVVREKLLSLQTNEKQKLLDKLEKKAQMTEEELQRLDQREVRRSESRVTS